MSDKGNVQVITDALPVTDKGVVMATTGLATVYYNPSQSIEGAVIIAFIFFTLLLVFFLLVIRCGISVSGYDLA